MGVLPAGAVGDPADRRPPHPAAEARHQEGRSLSYPRGEDLRDQLSHVGASVVQGGLVVGSGGNLSARVPGSDVCWVTGAGTWLDRLDRASFVGVRLSDGSVVAGDAPATTELRLHLATYQARPDVNAIVHLHPQLAVLLTALGQPIRLVTTDHAAYVRRVATVPYSPPGSQELADAAAAAVADGTDCVILANHGCSVLAGTVEMAHRRALNLEEAARLTYRAILIRGGLPADHPLVEAPAHLGTSNALL